MFCRIGTSLLLTVLAGAAFAAPDPSGTVVNVNQNANASGAGGARVLLSQGAVFMGDEITTDYRGVAQIIFVDNTRFVIGPNSRTIIDRFVFNPDKTAQAVTITATKGAFRFITGVSRHDAYNIRTPAMTIGVRGTAFDFTVEAGTGRVWKALYEGATTDCDSSGNCVTVQDVCAIVVALPGGAVGAATPDQLRTAIATRFPFLGSQANLGEGFRVNTASCDGVRGRKPPNIPSGGPNDRDAGTDFRPTQSSSF